MWGQSPCLPVLCCCLCPPPASLPLRGLPQPQPGTSSWRALMGQGLLLAVDGCSEGLCPTPGPALPLPRALRAQGQVFREAQFSFQHCSTAKGEPKASEKQPLAVTFFISSRMSPRALWGAHSHSPPLGWGFHHLPSVGAHRVMVLAKVAHSKKLQLPLELWSTRGFAPSGRSEWCGAAVDLPQDAPSVLPSHAAIAASRPLGPGTAKLWPLLQCQLCRWRRCWAR